MKLVPATPDDCNYTYYQERLANPELLDQALCIPEGDMLVPVGGKRQGGYANVGSRAEGKAVVAAMRHYPELFPNARFRGHVYNEGYGTHVEWGIPDDFADWSWWPDDERGRFFGYREGAIYAFEQRLEHYEATGDWREFSDFYGWDATDGEVAARCA